MHILEKILNKIRYEYRLPYERYKIGQWKRQNGSSLAVRKILDQQMIVDLDDEGISRKLFFKGIHEPLSTAQYMKEIKPGMTIVEVGSNIGYYAILGAKIVGETGKVFAFEPNPDNYHLLKMNIALNGWENLFETFPYGVGAENGSSTFYMMNKGNTSSFIQRNDSTINIEKELTVKMVCLDDFFEDQTGIDYFRMDVEGYELEVIKGMENILKSDKKPRGAFIEVHSALLNKMGSSARKFVDMMQDYGYRVKLGRYRGLAEYTIETNQAFLAHDLREEGYWEVFFEVQD